MIRTDYLRPSTLRHVLLVAFALLAGSVLAMAPAPRVASAAEFSYVHLSVAHRAACAVSSTGVGVCWGRNSNQYLLPNMPNGPISTPTQVALPNGEIFSTIDAGENNTVCAQAVSGRAYCWGDHHIGSYFTTTSRVPVQVEFPNDMRVTNVQSGYANGCALDPDLYLWCWGDALTLGDGNTEPIRIPTRVPMPDGGKVFCGFENAADYGFLFISQFEDKNSHRSYCVKNCPTENGDISAYPGNITVTGYKTKTLGSYCIPDDKTVNEDLMN